jgi:hypothetical protein
MAKTLRAKHIEEQATNYETMKHIQLVGHWLHHVAKLLLDRAENHDRSKLEPPEVQDFTKHTPALNGLTYGSPEYFAQLKQFQPTLDHHYANNRHHPQHFKNGIEDMNLVDLIEMFCDWNASGKRHKDGNLRKSIEVNATRFNINPQLVKILENSMELFDQ